MSDYADRELLALDQIEDVLKAYADARLSPTTPVLARMRAAVVAHASANELAAAAQPHLDTDRVTGRRWALPRFQLPRRAAALGLAATLTLGTSAAVLAAPPGSPLYSARVALENAFLPSDADARLAAHEERIANALADAQIAAATGNPDALVAALGAYQDEVDAAVSDMGDDPDRLAHLEAELGKHVVVLTALEAKLPTQAAIEHAIVTSQKAVDRLKEKGSHAPKPTPPPHPTHVPTTDGPDQNQGGGNS
jgi:hypothetical protein